MTDHKAEWVLVPRVATEAMCDATDCAPRLARATWEKMIAAAPAASEGEDGSNLLMAVVGRAHFGNPIPQEWYAAARELLARTRPAAQVAATPKHDEGREAGAWPDDKLRGKLTCLATLLQQMNAQTAAAAVVEAIAAIDAALATRPAARRVTEEAVFRAAAAFANHCGLPCDHGSMRAALESFAQPAEGVSE